MKILTSLQLKFILVLFVYLNCKNFVFSQNVAVIEDDNFEQLLNEKRKLNASLIDNSTYKIQIFNGSSEESKKNLLKFKRENKDMDATIIFNTPNYKVLVGNFLTRIEGERFLKIMKKNYPNSILIKPKD